MRIMGAAPWVGDRKTCLQYSGNGGGGSTAAAADSMDMEQQMAMHYRLGVDLGGTKIEIVALDADGRERLRTRVPTPRDDYDATLTAVADLVREAERALGAAVERLGIGIGTPGSVSRATGLLRGSNSVWLNGRPLHADLEARLGRPVRLTNDANCFALSEAHRRGRQRQRRRLRGDPRHRCGRGHRRRRQGARRSQRDRGRMGAQSAAVARGRRASGPRLLVRARGLHRDVARRDPRARSTMPRAPESMPSPRRSWLPQRPAMRDAERSIARYEHRLARALAHVVNLLDPDAIVLGGGMSNIERLYANVPRLWGRWIFSDRVDTRLVRHRHGDSSGVRGAARLWPAP